MIEHPQFSDERRERIDSIGLTFDALRTFVLLHPGADLEAAIDEAERQVKADLLSAAPECAGPVDCPDCAAVGSGVAAPEAREPQDCCQGTMAGSHEPGCHLFHNHPPTSAPSVSREPDATMREALEPFADIGAWLFARDLPDDTPMVEIEGINGYNWALTRGDFKAAHSALHPQAHPPSGAASRPEPPSYVDHRCPEIGRDTLQGAFVSGAKWWEVTSTGGTMWASDRDKAWAEAERRYPLASPSSARSEPPSRADAGGGRAELCGTCEHLMTLHPNGRCVMAGCRCVDGCRPPALSSPPVGEGVREALEKLTHEIVKWKDDKGIQRQGGLEWWIKDELADALKALLTSGVREAPAEPQACGCEDGWVCENHPDKGWPSGCECGAGMPCPRCATRRREPDWRGIVMDLHAALGIEWGTDPYAVIAALRADPPAAREPGPSRADAKT